MKKIINGKVYDTSTATLVSEWDNGLLHDRLNATEENLYQKKTGEFFLYGCGGPNTRYARIIDANNWSGGEKIIPLSYGEAQNWAEEHLSTDDYEKIFGKIAEDDSKSVLTLYLSTACVEMAKREASKKGIPLSQYIENILGNALPN